MAMERVTVEQNGERFTLEVPEGTSDEQIRQFIMQQQGAGAVTAPQPQATDYMATQAGVAAARPLATAAAAQVGDAAKLARIVGQVTPSIAGEFLSSPLKSARELASAYIAGHPWAGKAMNTPLKAVPGIAARGAMGALMAPESIIAAPYMMAAYEQDKIRQNPNAPGLEFNPYAQVQRGEASTIGRAGRANQMRAVANMPYGNVTPEERAILDEDARMRQNIRKKAYEKVMGPVVPGSF